MKQKNKKNSSNYSNIMSHAELDSASAFSKISSRNKFGMTFIQINNLVLFLLLLFFLPTQFGKHFFFDFSYLSGIRVDYLAPTLYLTDIIVFFIAILNWKSLLKFFKNRNLLFLLILFLINVFLAQSIPLAFYRFIKIVEFIIVLSMANTFLSEDAVFLQSPGAPCRGEEAKKHVSSLMTKPLLFILTLGAFIQSILTSLQFIFKHSLQGIFYYLGERYLTISSPDIAKGSLNGVEILRPYGTFSHPNSMAGFYLLLYVFVLTYKNFDSHKILKAIFLLLSSFLILISFSKAAIFTFLLLNIFYFVKKIRTGKYCRICVISRVFILFMLSWIFMTFQSDPLSVAKRLDLVKNSLAIIYQHPLIGTGIGNYLLLQNKIPSLYLYFFAQPVHNIFLLFIAETGIIISLLVFWEGLKLIKINIHKDVFVFSLIVIIITGLFDHYWLSLEQNFLLLAVIGGIIGSRKKTL